MAKYFMPRPINAPVLRKGAGPNYSCTTEPITPLTDVTVPEGLAAINAAIDRMAPNGNTNVPEGMAWGWRTVSSGEPFTQGRPNRKGQRQGRHRAHRRRQHLWRPSSTRSGRQQVDLCRLWLSAAGYNGTGIGRLLTGTGAGQFDYSSGNYTTALDEHMATLCDHAKAGKHTGHDRLARPGRDQFGENKAIEALKKCASDSRFRKDPTTVEAARTVLLERQPAATLEPSKFKEIADELSNLQDFQLIELG